jgi:hypothetical protein
MHTLKGLLYTTQTKTTLLISSICKEIAHMYLQKLFASGFLCQSFLPNVIFSAKCNVDGQRSDGKIWPKPISRARIVRGFQTNLIF